MAATAVEILDPPKQPLLVDAVLDLLAATTPLNATSQSMSWSSSDSAIATVNSRGVVLARAPGTTTITMTSADGKLKAACPITVAQAAAGKASGAKPKP